MAKKLGAEFVLVRGAGHFNAEAGYTKFERLLREFFPNEIVFVLHGKTKVDSSKPVSQWELDEEGRFQAKKLAETGLFDYADIIISSDEKKAIETASFFAGRIGKEIVIRHELRELDRDASGFLEKDVFDKTVKKCLENPDKSVKSWETADHALKRFQEGIQRINDEWKGKRIIVVSHGLVVNLYFARLLGKMDEVWERTMATTFCSWGIVKYGKVVKGIVEG